MPNADIDVLLQEENIVRVIMPKRIRYFGYANGRNNEAITKIMEWNPEG